MFDWFKKKKDVGPSDTDKLAAENDKTLAMLSTLATKVQANNQANTQAALDQQAYIDRLRQEGSGL